MTLGPAVAPARLWNRRRRMLIVAVIAAGCIAAAAWRSGRSATTAPSPPYICVMPESPPSPSPPPARPLPPAGLWADLERCLAAQPTGAGYPAPVTLAQVQGWVAEGDPVWFSEGNWWFPASGEGDAHVPSGYYIAVPSCGGAIMN